MYGPAGSWNDLRRFVLSSLAPVGRMTASGRLARCPASRQKVLLTEPVVSTHLARRELGLMPLSGHCPSRLATADQYSEPRRSCRWRLQWHNAMPRGVGIAWDVLGVSLGLKRRRL